MNHALWKATGARVLAMTFIIAGVAACDRGERNDSSVRQPAAVSPSAQVIGTTPAEPAPSSNTAQTVPVSPEARSDVTKGAENTKRPIEGDNHSHSTLAPTTPQKAEGANVTGAGEGGQR